MVESITEGNVESNYSMTRKYSSKRSELLGFTKKNTIDLIFIMNYSRYSKELTIFA